MKIVLAAPRQLHLVTDAAPPPPAAGHVTVRVLRVGVCGTDLHAFAGEQAFLEYPRVLGHELAVEVTHVGPPATFRTVTPPEPASASAATPVRASTDRAGSGIGANAASPPLRVGDRCTVIPYLSDGTCDACLRGRENCCEDLRVLGVHVDGGMRSALNLPLAQIIVANDLKSDALALVEMLSIGAHAVRRAELAPEDRVLVVGAGPIGLATATFARLAVTSTSGGAWDDPGGATGDDARDNPADDLDGTHGNAARVTGGEARLALLDRSPTRSAFAARLGLGTVVVAEGDPLPAVREAFGGRRPTVVFDATGSARAIEHAPSLAAHGGKVVLVGHTKAELRFQNPLLHGRELSLLFSRNATRHDFDTVLKALRSGAVDPLPWITHRASPERLVRDLPDWLDPERGVVKAMLEVA